MKRVVLFVAVFIALFAYSGVAQAQSAEQILSFETNISLGESGTARMAETIQYDFGSAPRRGIYRDIPNQYIVEGDQGYELDIAIISVTRNGTKEDFAIQNESSQYTRVRIGDPDVYISGVHTYVIAYDIGPLAIAADDGNEIVRIDVPGTDWTVSTQQVTATLNTSLSLQESYCYLGTLGSSDQLCNRNSATSFSSSRPIIPGETMTTEYVFAAGTFTDLATLTTINISEPIPWLMLSIFAIVFLAPLLYGIGPALGYIRYRQRLKQEIAYPRYERPKDLGPAELGLLIDNSSSGAELTATIMNLAITGYLKIVLKQEKKWYRKAEYEFVKRASNKPLREYEKDLYKALFDGDKDTISTKDLPTSTSFRKANQAFHKTLKSNLKNLGFYKPANFFSPTLATRMSDEGYAKWAEIEGFRRFLNLTEAKRMEMLDAPERTPEQFSEYLPYAVALGVEKKWAEQFKHLDIDASEWYEGPRSNYAAYYLASSLASDLHSVSAVANQSSGSSGAGGGFSGGGFSGGGGGSW